MNITDCKAIRSAAATLMEWADSLREGHTPPSDRNNWTGEETAKRWHDKHIALAKRLRQIAKQEDPRPRKRPQKGTEK